MIGGITSTLSGTPAWAKLRQVIIATATHAADAKAIGEAFGLSEPFADPEIGELQIVDATFAISPDRFLEVVGTTSDTSPMAAWLTKVDGRAGYCLSVQHPDPDGVRQRCFDAGKRLPIDLEVFGKTVLQLHPKDFGVLLEIDGIDDADVWFWDDISPGPAPDALISDVVGVAIPVDDPVAMTKLWADVLAIDPVPGETMFDMSGATVRLIDAADHDEWTIIVKSAGADVTPPDFNGVAFRVV